VAVILRTQKKAGPDEAEGGRGKSGIRPDLLLYILPQIAGGCKSVAEKNENFLFFCQPQLAHWANKDHDLTGLRPHPA
jgi:hypothetical protein